MHDSLARNGPSAPIIVDYVWSVVRRLGAARV
jgi:hypothetical protein